MLVEAHSMSMAFLLVISHIFSYLFASKKVYICAMFQSFPHLKNSLKRILKNDLSRWLLKWGGSSKRHFSYPLTWTLTTSYSFIWYILLDRSREDSTLWPPAQTGRSEEARKGWSKGAEREMLSPMLDRHQQGDEGSDRTMILLYGAGGGPGRGGRPMDSIRSRASDDFPLCV